MRIGSSPRPSSCSTIRPSTPRWPAPTIRSATAGRRNGSWNTSLASRCAVGVPCRGYRYRNLHPALACRGSMINDTKPTVCVVGLGYIGLPTAAIVARAGCPVLGLDVSQAVVDTINRGEIHIEEVDLDGLVHGVVQRGLLRAATRIEACEVYVVAVPTPFARDDHHTPDVSYVLAAATEIAAVLKPGDLVILESTSPVGTTERVRDLL